MKQKKNMLGFALIAIAAVVLMACEKEELVGNKLMILTYQQTQCADAWQTGASDNQTIQNLKNYLAGAGMEGPMLDINLLQLPDAPPATCTGCTCPTGKQFIVSVLESETLKQKYVQAGFVVKP